MTTRPSSLFALTLTLATGVLLGITLHQALPMNGPDHAELRRLNRLIEYVHDNYVDAIGYDKLVDGAMSGMFEQLDAHSRLLDAESMQELTEETHGDYGGIGIEVSLVDGFFTVIHALDDSPARSSGIVAGDRITAVDAQALKGRRLGELTELLRGKPGTPVSLRVVGEGGTRDVTLTRERIDLGAVTSRRLAGDVGYVRVTLFHENTAEKLRRAIETLDAKGAAPLAGLILDLRNNPGGLLTAAVAVADLFLEDGAIVHTAGRGAESSVAYSATPGGIRDSLPLVILIDGATASAAEVVTAALHDRQRATVMGTKSYGKGSVQTLFGIDQGRGIKLTTAHYTTPDGQDIDGIGIAPDIPWDGDYDALVDAAAGVLLSAGKQTPAATPAA
ncbi:MAG: S41 family peptidase [Pseudomonadales bacterium]|nr:S41 family peptidase [Pseudomonadales bacterium]